MSSTYPKWIEETIRDQKILEAILLARRGYLKPEDVLAVINEKPKQIVEAKAE